MVNEHAMVVPSARSLLLPLRRIKETVPEVVGSHERVKGSPAVAWRPVVGILKGFAPEPVSCARAVMAALSARSNERVKYIVVKVGIRKGDVRGR